MALTDTDLQKIQKATLNTVTEALEQVVFPKFDELGVKIEEVNTRVGLLEEKVDSLGEKVESLEEKVDYTNRRMDVLVGEFKDHDHRITRLEAKVNITLS